MKLRGARSERERKSRSVDVVGKPEDENKIDFDPRVDFPAGEMGRLKKLAGNKTERIKQLHAPDNLRDAWWLSLIDSEFKQLLYSDPEFKDALFAKFDGYFSHAAGNPRMSVEGVLSFAIPSIQLFPELRDILRKQRVDEMVPRLMKKETPTPELYAALFKLMPMLLLYPERRDELLKVYSIEKDEVITRLSETMNENLSAKVKANVVANALLVFPELRSNILNVANERGKWKAEFATEHPPLRTAAFEFGFHLSVIGAESASIDTTGRIHLQLRPTTIQRTTRSLPERSVE